MTPTIRLRFRLTGQNASGSALTIFGPEGTRRDDTGLYPIANFSDRGPFAAENAVNARLIVAAVNAVREAGYTAEELAAGRLQADREIADKKWAHADERYCAQAEKDRADLVDCREMLDQCRQTLGGIVAMSIQQEDADGIGRAGLNLQTRQMANRTLEMAHALLALLDAERPPATTPTP